MTGGQKSTNPRLRLAYPGGGDSDSDLSLSSDLLSVCRSLELSRPVRLAGPGPDVGPWTSASNPAPSALRVFPSMTDGSASCSTGSSLILVSCWLVGSW